MILGKVLLGASSPNCESDPDQEIRAKIGNDGVCARIRKNDGSKLCRFPGAVWNKKELGGWTRGDGVCRFPGVRRRLSSLSPVSCLRDANVSGSLHVRPASHQDRVSVSLGHASEQRWRLIKLDVTIDFSVGLNPSNRASRAARWEG
jgi:hypothetical protein